jgi:hypothetical protein
MKSGLRSRNLAKVGIYATLFSAIDVDKKQLAGDSLMKRVTGIGGIFFQSESPAHLYDWYEKHLGIKREPHGQGSAFEWRELRAPDGSEPGAQGA